MINNRSYITECHNIDVFGEWLDEELNKRGVSQYAFAQNIGFTATHVNHVIHGRRQPSCEMLVAIAKGLRLPVVEVFQKAGIFPPATENNILNARLNYLFSLFPDDEKDELLTYMQLKIEILKKQGKIKGDV